MDTIEQIIIFLLAAVVFVPLFKRFGLGAVLGYLMAGIVIGPSGLQYFSDVDQILHFAELGVVFLLFIIGLELQPSRLWALRRSIFGWGALQLFISALLIALVVFALGISLQTAVLIGLILGLSSTAFALQLLAERNEITTRHGRSAFAILLFQDMAVVPLLAIIPLISTQTSIDSGAPLWRDVLESVLVLAAVILIGRYVLRYALRVIAITNIREILTATALLMVLGTALILDRIGLSMALGAFLAGMLLADSEFRHQLEADIEPFKGLLLGLFFIAVGMSVDLSLLMRMPLLVIGLALILVVIKAAVLYLIGRLQGLNNASAKGLALTLSQGGEFAFVLSAVALSSGVMDKSLTDLMIIVVTLSMVTTPLVLALNDFLAGMVRHKMPEFDQMPDENNPVIIAGFGRFGQITARLLRAKKISFTALDISQTQVDFVRKYGNRIFYGDASRLDLLRAANADKASIFVLAIDDINASLKTAEIVLKHFPNLTIYARAHNRKHAYQLMDLGVEIISRETFLSALDIARQVLTGLGLSESEAEKAAERFKQHDLERLHEHQHFHADEDKYLSLSRAAAKELEELFEQDASENK